MVLQAQTSCTHQLHPFSSAVGTETCLPEQEVGPLRRLLICLGIDNGDGYHML